MAFFLIMERDLGVDHQEIQQVAQNLLNVKVNQMNSRNDDNNLDTT